MTQVDLTGRSLGGYRILRKLGQGGMAVVYKAHEESLNRVVALKVIAEHLAADEQFITRFQREAQAAAQLNHPNIVQIYAIGEDQGVHFFSMEFVKGRSLAEIIEEEGFLTAGRALPIIAQAAEALSVAHDAGIVHRDIKPANIMVDGNGRVKVADFGIAQMATATRMTQSGMLVGTPEFISPEQCRGEKLDGRSDIYSLGVTLYQLLAGRTPFNADTPAALVFQIVEGPKTPVSELNPTVSSDVQAIVARMMHTDRNQRFQSAEDLVHALRHADTQPVTSAGRPHPVPGVVAADLHSDPTVAMPPAGAAAATAAAGEATRPTGATDVAPATTPGAAADAGSAGGSVPDLATTAVEGVSTGAPITHPDTSAGTASPATAPELTPTAASKHAAAPSPPAERPSPATQAYAANRGSNRGALVGLAAAVLVLLTVLLVGWQFMRDSNADEPFDPTVAARPQGAPEQGETAATGNDAAGGTDSGASVGSDAAGGADTGTSTGNDAAGAGGTGAAVSSNAAGSTATSAGNGDATGAATASGATVDARIGAAGATPAGATAAGIDAGAPAAPGKPTSNEAAPPQPRDDPQAAGTAGTPASAAQLTTGQPAAPQTPLVEEPAVRRPPDNAIVAETTGEYEYVEQVHAWMEREFGDLDFDVIDFPSSPYASMQEAARFQVVTTARLVGSEQLEYFGNSTTQYTVSLISRVTDLSNGRTVVGPQTETVKYTSVNMQQNLQQAVTRLARAMARELRALIRTP